MSWVGLAKQLAATTRAGDRTLDVLAEGRSCECLRQDPQVDRGVPPFISIVLEAPVPEVNFDNQTHVYVMNISSDNQQLSHNISGNISGGCSCALVGVPWRGQFQHA